MDEIIYRELKPEDVASIENKFGDYVVVFNCFHFGEGCVAFGAFKGEEPVGFIAIHPEPLISPLVGKYDAYIDAIEVDSTYRRRGIGKRLVGMTEAWAKDFGYRQIRAWSSDDRAEAIPMWYTLDYGLCPAYMYGEDLRPGKDGSKPMGYYLVKLLNPGKKTDRLSVIKQMFRK